MLLGCRTIKEIPVEHRIEYTYIDSLRIKDSTVYYPKERIVDVVPAYDSLKMETSLAEARAWVDTTTHTLKGSIENKEGVQYKYIFKDKIQYRDSLVYKEVPVPVEVEIVKTKYPAIFWWLLGWCILSIAGIVLFIYAKIRS